MFRRQRLMNLLKIDSSDPLDLRSRGADYFMLGLYGKALEDLNESLRLKPNNLLVLRLKIDIHCRLEQHVNALEGLNKLLENKQMKVNIFNQHIVLALRMKGKTYLKLNQYNDVLNDLNQALEIEPYDTAALRVRGETHLRLNQYNNAL